MRKALYTIVNVKNNIVFVEDLDGPVSVTNDALNVSEAVKFTYGRDARVVYKDTQGEWWEILQTFEQEALYTNFASVQIEFRRWHGLTWDILSR